MADPLPAPQPELEVVPDAGPRGKRVESLEQPVDPEVRWPPPYPLPMRCDVPIDAFGKRLVSKHVVWDPRHDGATGDTVREPPLTR